MQPAHAPSFGNRSGHSLRASDTRSGVRRLSNRPLWTLTIEEAVGLTTRGEVSAVELTNAVLARINEVDAKLNSYITVDASGARTHAAQLDAKRRDALDPLGPLHGIPVAIKDNIHTAGLRTTAGSRILADFVPATVATVVARLRYAGAVIVGKTNLHEFAWGGTTDNPHFGPTRNPWDTTRFPAGSSGGAGAAVAAGACLASLGTDTGGSIRLPAAMCGTVGLRPTIGRVSNHNVVPCAWSMDTVGPLTRTVKDNAVITGVIAGWDQNDPSTSDAPVPDYGGRLEPSVDGLRIGIVEDYFFSHLQPDVRDTVQAALAVLAALGATIQRVDIEGLRDAFTPWFIVHSCEPSTWHQHWLRERPEDYGDDVRQLLLEGELYSATQYIQAQRFRTMLRTRLISVLKDVDVLISPTVPFVATAIGSDKVTIVDGVEEDMLPLLPLFTLVASATGLPAMSVPCGFSRDLLPIGMQIIGRPFAEPTLFQVGHAYEVATDWHEQRPPI